jgi:hypothetical protein
VTDGQAQIVELIAGLMIIPWCIWVTTSIYAQREEIKLMKYQIKVLDRIEASLVSKK